MFEGGFTIFEQQFVAATAVPKIGTKFLTVYSASKLSLPSDNSDTWSVKK